ncbi:opine metallophore biosynthesis dehydrogenase [Fictibacillus nanhaiensis]|uniref:opine metallophore biosynthesis dehydrogenase n=1 Tax=Fictibacillus nanhaiensis TaxID=742169 RepID=UPI0030B855A4
MQTEIPKNEFGNTLIAGAGPAGIQIAVQLSKGWSKKIGLYNRPGIHAARVREELACNHNEVALTIQGEHSGLYAGRAKIDQFYDDASLITDMWDTLILCTPCSSYGDVMTTLQLTRWHRLKTIILLSPNIGSNSLVKSYLNERNKVEVISLSTYFAATKLKGPGSVLVAHTKAFKKRVYIGSSRQDSMMLNVLLQFLQSVGVDGVKVDTPVAAECRNITTYVHPPLFMNSFTLKEVFHLSDSPKKFMYKLYPEGPITQHVIKQMVTLWKEISRLVEKLDGEPINLLKFLNDDNYPVPEECLSRNDIERFVEYEETKQEYLLYIRYASILIDPFSEPDEDGRYFDFSRVPYKKSDKDYKGKWRLPRIPFEDYQKLKVLYGVGQQIGINMPKTKELIVNFEAEYEKVEGILGSESFSREAFQDTSNHDIEAIMKERGMKC